MKLLCLLVFPALFATSLQAQDWAARLPQPEASAVAGEAAALGQTEALLKALANADEATVERFHAPLMESLPGGKRAAGLSPDIIGMAMSLAVRGKTHRAKAFFRLAKIHDLAEPALRDVAAQTMKSVPVAEWPAGFERYQAEAPAPVDPALMAKGKAIYDRPGICVTCHQPNGQGLPFAFPPLAGSPWLKGKPDRQIKIVLKGMMGPVKVGDQEFNSAMLPLESLLTDEEIAAVLTYVRNEWGHKESAVTPEQVKVIREALKDRPTPWMAEEILKEHPLGE